VIDNASCHPTPLSEVDLSTSFSAATGYTASCGFSVIPIASGAKKCTLKKWQDLRLDVPDLAAHFNGHPQNIGVLLGAPSGGLMDVDVDCPEAAIIAPTYLPATDAVFGRAGKPASHWLYRVSDGAKTVQFEGKKGEMLIELRGDGTQTVFPPSIHESGEAIRFERCGSPAPVQYDDLSRRVSIVAAASLLARHWPASGSRHHTALALAGGLLRAGWSVEDTQTFIRAVAEAAGDNEVEDRVRSVTSTQEKLELGEPARGWPYLAEIIEKKLIDKVRKWLRISIPVSAGRDDIPYVSTPTGLVYMKFTPEGAVPVMLTNFNARIVSDVQEDDGVETRRTFGIEAALAGRQPVRFAVPADEFAGLNWITHFLGAKAIVRPGQSIAGHTRVAIQELSEDIDERLVYGHSGWRVIDGHHVYLHCGGGISADGLIDDVEVALAGSLNGYVLPAPPSGSELTTAVQASLKLLDLGPAALMYVLLATVFRAAVGGTDYSIWIFGRTGTFKSELATLLQRHFGAFTARSLPGSWSSTANALEDQGFRAKDTIFVIDDFKPSGSGDEKLHQQADRLLRAAGTDYNKLTVANADGTHRTVIWTKTQPKSWHCGDGSLDYPAWSPDLDGDATNGYQGTIVVASRVCSTVGEPGRLQLVDVVVVGGVPQGTNIRDLVTSGVDPSVDGSFIEPEWSPDQDPLTPGYQGKIAFQGGLNNGAVSTVSVIDMYWDGSTAQPVYGPNTSVILWYNPGSAGPRYPTWSPDGQQIAFQAFDSIYLMAASTGEIVDIVSGFSSTPGDLQWSRTGSRIAFVMAVAQIYTVDVELGISSLQPVARGAPCSLREVTWSPDDNFIVFAAKDCGSRTYWTIRRTDLDTSQVTTLISESRSTLLRPDWRRF